MHTHAHTSTNLNAFVFSLALSQFCCIREESSKPLHLPMSSDQTEEWQGEREIQRRSTAEERYSEVRVHCRVEQAIKVTLWGETCLLWALWECRLVKVKELLIGWGCCRVYPASPLYTPTLLWRWPGFEHPQWLERRDRWGSLWKEAQKESKVGGPGCVRESLQLAHTDCHAK